MTAPNARLRLGMTLIELLTSVTIGVVLATISTVAFIHILKAQTRLLSRLEMHNSARFAYQSMSEEFSALQQDGALWLETTADNGSGNGLVCVTFLHAMLDEHGFTTNSQRWQGGEIDAVYQNRCSDLNWCCWRWNQQARTLATGVNSLPRQFRINPSWVGPAGDFGSTGCWFVNMPQPLRQAMPYPQVAPIGSSQAALGGNRYGSTDNTNDLSDYQDLSNNLSPILHDVVGFHVEMLLSDGSVVDADNTQTQTLGYDGVLVNGQCLPALNGVQAYLKRPRLIRVLIDMQNPLTGVTQSFSFSFRSANVLPLTYGAGKSIP